jgi:CO/xanthine dehydrogenase FAD-binding subunit
LGKFMPIRLREYHRPLDAARAAELLQREDVRTLPIVHGPRVRLDPYAQAEAVVDLGLLRLNFIATHDGFVHIGGQTPLQSLIDAAQLQALAGGLLPKAAQFAAHLGLRHLATLGGALLSADGPPEIQLALIALEAKVVTMGAGRKTTPLIQYQQQENDLVLEVNFKHLGAEYRGALARVARTPLDQAIVAAVAVVGPDFARVAVAGAGPAPIVKSEQGSAPNLRAMAEAIEAGAQVVGDYRGSAEYRRAIAGVLAGRALAAAWGEG